MTRGAKSFLVCALFLPATLAAEEEDPAARVVETMRRYIERIPDYSCVETITRRLSDPNPDRRRETEDRLRVEVALIDGRERYAWPGATSFDADSPAQLVGYGVSSSGEFGPHAKGIFLSPQAVIRFEGEEEKDGRKLLRFEYEVPQAASTYWLAGGAGRRRVGYNGEFLANPHSGEVVRLEIRAREPSGVTSIVSTSTIIDLSRSSIGGAVSLLPERAVVETHMTDGVDSTNTHVFSDCLSFSSESTISFSETAPAQPVATPNAAEPNSDNRVVPPGVLLRLELTAGLHSDTAAAGDPFEAVLLRDALDNKDLIAPQGAAVRGRVLQVERLIFPGSRTAITLQLTELSPADGKVFEVHATLQSIERAPPLQRLMSIDYMVGPTRDVRFARDYDVAREQPLGLGSFYVLGGRFEIRPGMRMRWRTIEPPASN